MKICLDSLKYVIGSTRSTIPFQIIYVRYFYFDLPITETDDNYSSGK